MKTKHIFIAFIFTFLISSCQQNPTTKPTVIFDSERSGNIDFLSQPKGTIRLMSFNVGWDSIFPDGDPLNDPFRTRDKSEAFIRILKAIQPQVLCLQEINPQRDHQQVADILDQAIPLDEGQNWQVHHGGDNFIMSAFTLRMVGETIIQGNPLTGRGHAMALIDLPDGEYTQDLYLICAHFKSQGGQSNINARQAHADAIVAWIRDLKTTGGEIDLPFGTPFSILGDLNVYDTDPAHHLVTLLTGDIADEGKYGPDITPDWNESALADVLPRHNLTGSETYTWRDDTQEFNPGILDHILYTDSVIRVEKSFVLNTMTLTDTILKETGLYADDVMLEPEVGNYDHLPLVVDFFFQPLAKE